MKRIKKITFGLVSDLINDNVKNRCIYPIFLVIYYIVMVFFLITVLVDNDTKPATISKKIDLCNNYYFSSSFSEIYPSPRIKVVTNDNNPASNTKIRLIITDFLPENKITSFSCDYEDRQNIRGSLHYFRMDQVCKIVLKNDLSTVNNEGLATFSNLNLLRGPQGNYGYKYNVEGVNSVRTSENFIYVNSEVGEMELMPGCYPPASQIIGQPFTNQPKLRITNFYGGYLSNKYVIAVSWPDPYIPSVEFKSAQKAFIDAIKFAYLKGDVSEPSDEDGIAEFKNLSIIGSTSNYTYIIFVCENSAMLLWTSENLKLIKAISYTKPIKLISNVASVKILTLPIKIEEGVPFGYNQSEINVLDINGEPISDKLVICLISSINEEKFNYRYSYVRQGFINKDIIKPFPGEYNDQILDPLSNEDGFNPILTNNDGMANFTETYFSVYGIIGNYTLEFVCDGISVFSSQIEVTSSVYQIKFSTQPLLYFSTFSVDISNFVPILLIKNKKNEGIYGKTPIIELLNSVTLTPLKKDELDLQLFYDDSKFVPSDESGYIKLIFSLKNISIHKSKIKAIVDGVSIISREIKFVSYLDDVSCAKLTLIQKPINNTIIYGETLNLKYQAKSNYNQNLENGLLLYQLYYNSKSLNSVPANILPYFFNKVLTDSEGFGQISIKFNESGISGSYYLKPILIYLLKSDEIMSNSSSDILNYILNDAGNEKKLCSDHYDYFFDSISQLENNDLISICIADEYQFNFIANIYKIAIKNSTIVTPLKFYKEYEIILMILDKNNQKLANYNCYLDFNLLKYPSYAHRDHRFMDTKDFKNKFVGFTQMSYSADINGDIIVKLQIKPFYVGIYAINFQAEGGISDPIEFQTEYPLKKISIINQSYYNFSLNDSTNKSEIKSKYLRSGDFLPPFQVKVTDENDNPISGIPIIAKAVNISNLTNFDVIIDVSEFFDKNSTLFLYSFLNSTTNDSGIATFTKLTSFDIHGDSACLRFKFVVGDTLNMDPSNFNSTYISSESSNIYCFYDSFSIDIYNKSYSRQISSSQNFDYPLEFKFQRSYITDLDLLMFNHIVVIASEILGKELKTAKLALLENYICIFSWNSLKTFECEVNIKNVDLLKSIAEKRNLELNLLQTTNFDPDWIKNKIGKYTKDIPYTAIVTFKNLRWTGSSNQAHFVLTASTILNIIQDDSEDVNSLINKIEQYSVKDLYNFVKNGSLLPITSGNKIAIDDVENLLNMSQSIQGIYQNISQYDISVYSDIGQKTLNLFSNTYGFLNLIKSILKTNNKNIRTEKIYVTSNVKKIQILIDVPPKITVGNAFQVSVKAKNSVGGSLKKAIIIAEIANQESFFNFFKQSDIDTIVSELGKGQLTGSSIGKIINAKSNVALDSRSKWQKTDFYGEAIFNLFFVSGKPGIYKISFSSNEDSTKTLSNSFILVNPIKSIELAINFSQEIELQQNKLSLKFVTLNIQPILQIKYENDETTTKSKNIEIKIYKSVDEQFETSLFLNKSLQSKESFESLYEQYKHNHSLNGDSFFKTLKSVWSAFISSGKIIKQIEQNFENLETQYTIPIETADSKFYFTDLKIKFRDYGDYKIVFIVDGIESQLSPVITLKSGNSDNTSANDILDILIISLICITILFVVMSNVGEMRTRYVIISCLIVILIMVALKFQKKFNTLITIILIVAFLVMLFLLFEIIFNSYSKNLKMFYKLKNKVFQEYVYQRFYLSPSYKWDSKAFKKAAEDKKNKKKLNENKNEIKEKNEDKKEDFSAIYQSKISYLKIFKQIFFPFTNYLKQSNIAELEPIYYPQKLIATFLCSLASIIYVSYKTRIFGIEAVEFLYDVDFKIADVYLDYLNKGMNYTKNRYVDINLSEASFEIYLSVIYFIRKQFHSISLALNISFTIGWWLALIFCLMGFVITLIDFKYRVILLRKGIKTFDIKQINGITPSTGFAGLTISNAVLAFLAVYTTFGIILFPLFWPVFWILVKEYIWVILVPIITAIVRAIIMTVSRMLLCSPSFVKHRRLFSAYEFIVIYISLASGIMTGIIRFFISLVISLFTLSMISEVLLPAWAGNLNFMLFDVVHRSYLSLIYTYHLHNNPTLLCFVSFIKKQAKKDLNKKSNKKLLIVRNKFHLAYFLTINQSLDLQKYRKKNNPKNLEFEKKPINESILEEKTVEEINERDNKELEEELINTDKSTRSFKHFI